MGMEAVDELLGVVIPGATVLDCDVKLRVEERQLPVALGLGSSRTRRLWRGTLFLNRHIHWHRKSNPVTRSPAFSTDGLFYSVDSWHVFSSPHTRNSCSAPMNYRPDIDGLRAIAVALVVFFHAQCGFPGGFVGVDVFFVISGFLITGIIRNQLASGHFSFREFWVRRIRRIVPAAAAMTLSTLALGYFFLFPSDYKFLAESAVFQQLMAANVYFWRKTGYFSGRADMMPLLHTWSLAVEEQFYLVYPVLLALLWRCGERILAWSLGGLAMASFGLSVWGVGRFPSATFFLLPTRAWELLLGGLLWSVPRIPIVASRAGGNVAATLGLLAIFLAAMTYTSTSLFPGAAAALPCGGAALIILAGTCGTPLVNRFLSSPPLVAVGLASYSIYLWHWPFLVFLRHISGPRPGPLPLAATVISSVAVALLSWRFIERVFRAGSYRPDGTGPFAAAFLSIPLICTICWVILTNEGFPDRAPEKAVLYHAASSDSAHGESIDTSRLLADDCPRFGSPDGPVSCLIWGDSHAMSMVVGLNTACRLCCVQGHQATYFGTAPILDFYISNGLGLRELAIPHSAAVFEYAKRNRIDMVVLAAFWTRYQTNSSLESRLRSTVDALTAAGIKVAIVLDYATQEEDVPLMLAREAFRGNSTSACGVTMAEYRKQNGLVNTMIRRVANGRAMVLDPALYLTDRNEIWRAEIDEDVLYYDDDHLSTAGSLRLAPMFSDMFARLLQQRCDEGE